MPLPDLEGPPLSARAPGARLRASGAYLIALALTPVLTAMAHHIWPTEPTFRGQPPAVFVACVGLIVAIALWATGRPAWHHPPAVRWSPVARAVLIAFAVLWAVTLGLSLLHGDLFDVTAFVPPVVLAMLWFEPPTRVAALRALDAWGLGIVVIAITAMALDFAGLRIIAPQGVIRWPLELIGLFGMDPAATVPVEQINACTICYGYVGRWEGPFGNVNIAGPIGATVLMLGLLRFGWRRWVMAVSGAIIVVLSDSRTALIAIAFACLAWVLSAHTIGAWRVRTWSRWVALAIAAVVAVGYVGIIDRNLNLRTEVWGAFVRAWPASPWLGVGQSGIDRMVSEGALPGWATHGHSMLIDALLRYGLLGMVLTLVTLALLVSVAVRAARRREVLPIVLISAAIGAGLTEDLMDWRYWSIAIAPVLLAGLVALRADPSPDAPAPERATTVDVRS